MTMLRFMMAHAWSPAMTTTTRTAITTTRTAIKQSITVPRTFVLQQKQQQQYNVRLFSSNGSNGLTTDDEGRTIRRRPSSSSSSSSSSSWDTDASKQSSWSNTNTDTNNNSNDNNNNDAAAAASGSSSGGGWDDFDPWMERTPKKPQPSSLSRGRREPQAGSNRDRAPRGGGGYNGGNRDRSRNAGGTDRSRDRRGGNNNNNNNNKNYRGAASSEKTPADRKINMKALEGAGFVHLYGLASCVNALQANRRDFTRPEQLISLDDLTGDDLAHELAQRERKPEAQYSPFLFVQESSNAGAGGPKTTRRSLDKTMAAERLEQLAAERNLPIVPVDKGVLNSLSGNRPHQGFVLRCGRLDWDFMTKLTPDKKLWLCLDEVVDPQNLGALLRSAYFMNPDDIGIVVCAKNSAPPSPVVSAASAGALEVATVYSTTNLPKLLGQAKEDGFVIYGASLQVPSEDSAQQVYDLQSLPPSVEGTPTVLVLGSEGHGLRTLVAKACTDFVCIPGGTSDVESLNVSVTGGILLWHLLNH